MAASLQRDYSSHFALSHQKWSRQISRSTRQLTAPFEILSPACSDPPEQEELLPILCFGWGVWKFGHVIKMPTLGLDLSASLALATMVGGHFWSPPPGLPWRFTQKFSFTLELLRDELRVLLRHRVIFMGENKKLRCFGSGGRNRSFSRRLKEQRWGDWLLVRTGLILLPLHCNSWLVFKTHCTISSVMRGGGLGEIVNEYYFKCFEEICSFPILLIHNFHVVMGPRISWNSHPDLNSPHTTSL